MPGEATRHSGRWAWRRWLFIVAVVVLGASCAVIAGRQSRLVVVHVDGHEQRLSIRRDATVEQALTAAGISVGALDRVSPPLSSPVSSSPRITIVRVATQEQTRQVSIPFSRLASEDTDAVRGWRAIAQAGADGLREIHELVTTEDGVEVRRIVTGDRVLQEATPEVVRLGSAASPPLDAFREVALAYLGRGAVTRLSPSVVEQTLFELARQRGDRYGSVRVLPRNERNWLVVQTFARTPEEATVVLFWWADELHAYAQVLGERMSLLDARATTDGAVVELGLVVASNPVSAAAPQYMLFRLPGGWTSSDLAATWRSVWSSQGREDWLSAQGTVSFSGDGLERLEVQGVSQSAQEAAVLVTDCTGCPRRRFASSWQRQGDIYAPIGQRLAPSPFATVWTLMDALQRGDSAAAAAVVSDTQVISAALTAGLGRANVRWTPSGAETDTTFDLRSIDASVRVTLVPRAGNWVVASIQRSAGQDTILFTGTRPVVRGLFAMDASAAGSPRSLGEGERYVWSPDYTRLAFDWQGQVYVADADGGNLRPLGPGVAASWAPAGDRLAVERPGASGPQIVVINVNNGDELAVATGRRPSWSPAIVVPSRLVYASAGSIPAVYMIDVAGGQPLLLASDGAGPLWSPDGSAVAFATSRQEIVVVTLAPARVMPVAKGWGYTWSPDGTRLAFISSAPAGRPMVWSRETGEVKPLLERDDVDGLSWSPDGKGLVYSLAGNGGLWLAGSDGANWRKWADGRDPVWAWTPQAGR